MKGHTTLCVFLILLGLGMVYSDRQKISFTNQQKFATIRAPQSCSVTHLQEYKIKEKTKLIGFHWDGQSCQPCSDSLCKCSEYNTCRDCIDGYHGLINGDKSDSRTCVKCPTLEEIDGYKSGLPGVRDASTLENPQVRGCKIFYDSNHDSEVLGDPSMIKGMRATRCGKNNFEEGIVYRHYGSVCWYMKGCLEYTKSGLCEKCLEGYYLAEDQTCKPCKKTCDNDTYLNTWDKDSTCTRNVSSCKICTSSDTCSVCADGFWLAYTSYFKNNHEQFEDGKRQDIIQDDSSFCAPCPSGCNCHVAGKQGSPNQYYDAKTKKFQNGFFSIRAQTGHYHLVGQASDAPSCPRCDSYKGQEGCAECTYDNKGTSEEPNYQYTCTKCHERVKGHESFDSNFPSSSSKSPTFYHENPVDGKCLECPEYCTKCEMVEGGISCMRNHCMNGTRPTREYLHETKNYRLKCTPCQIQNAIRCETEYHHEGAKGEVEIPTQCKTGQLVSGGSFDYIFDAELGPTLPSMNYSPPNENDYLLVKYPSTIHHEQKIRCIQNKKYCRTITLDESKSSDDCATCYEGYRLSSSNACVKTIAHCKTYSGNACGECEDGFEVQFGKCTKKDTCDLDNCLDCNRSDDTETCNKCSEGYRINSDKKCESCSVQNCKQCDSHRDSCESCLPRFSLWTGEEESLSKNIVCEACEWNCLTCENRKVCTECAEGYMLMSGVCHKQLNHCVQLDPENTNHCKWCLHGYRLTPDKTCMKCFAPEQGTIHCPTYGECNHCWYSTVNDLNLYGTQEKEKEEEEEQQETGTEIEEEEQEEEKKEEKEDDKPIEV